MSKTNNDTFYCKACVLANERADYNDKPLKRKEVREIFSNARNLNFDIEHDHNYLSGIDIVENHITTGEDEIDGEPVPEGSWLMTLRIINPELRESIESGVYTGVSLETNFTSDVEVTDYDNERLQYKDVLTKEEMMPVTVSFTSKPANMMPMEVMTHEQYTAKNKGDEYMQEDQEDEVTFLRGFVEKIFTGGDSDAEGTAKSIGATPQPQNNNFQYQELIESLIESQKSIPSLTQKLEALSESQVKMAESFNNLSTKIDNAVLARSTDDLETNEEQAQTTDNTQQQEQEQQQEQREEEEEQEQEEQEEVQAQTTDNTQQREEEQEQQQPSEGEEQPTRQPIEQPPAEEGEDTEDEDTEDEEDDEKKKQGTAKNIKGANTQRPLTVDNKQKSQDRQPYKDFMINRSYEHLVGRND